MAYENLLPGINGLSSQIVIHFAIDMYNCAVDIFQQTEYALSSEWASKTLDFLSPISKGEQKDKVVLNTSRLLVRALCIEDPDKAATIVKDLETVRIKKREKNSRTFNSNRYLHLAIPKLY